MTGAEHVIDGGWLLETGMFRTLAKSTELTFQHFRFMSFTFLPNLLLLVVYTVLHVVPAYDSANDHLRLA